MESRIPYSPPIIKPLSKKDNRPVWSVMIPVYNCSRFLPETLESVLSQDISEDHMEIEVIDDASTDADVESLVYRIGNGRIKYYRQPQNIGSLRNFETCLNRSKGRLIHLLHGDDIVRPNYYEIIGQLLQKFPEAGAAFSGFSFIDELSQEINKESNQMENEGILKDWLLRIGERNCIQYASLTVKREVYEKLGSFYGVNFGEDWEMWVRIAKFYPVAYTPLNLAGYRQHVTSISADKFLKGDLLRDLNNVMCLIQRHLPEQTRAIVLKKSKKYYSWYALKLARLCWERTGSKSNIHSHLFKILSINADFFLIKEIIRFYIKTIINNKKNIRKY